MLCDASKIPQELLVYFPPTPCRNHYPRMFLLCFVFLLKKKKPTTHQPPSSKPQNTHTPQNNPTHLWRQWVMSVPHVSRYWRLWPAFISLQQWCGSTIFSCIVFSMGTNIWWKLYCFKKINKFSYLNGQFRVCDLWLVRGISYVTCSTCTHVVTGSPSLNAEHPGRNCLVTASFPKWIYYSLCDSESFLVNLTSWP